MKNWSDQTGLSLINWLLIRFLSEGSCVSLVVQWACAKYSERVKKEEKKVDWINNSNPFNSYFLASNIKHGAA